MCVGRKSETLFCFMAGKAISGLNPISEMIPFLEIMIFVAFLL